jgi:uncharacterized membrane protein YgcG
VPCLSEKILEETGRSCWRSKSAGSKARLAMRWNPSTAVRHPPEGCTGLWCPSGRNGRMPKTSIKSSMPSGTASRPRTRTPCEPHGEHRWAKIIMLLVLLGLPAGAQEHFPAQQGRVNDFAQALDPSTKAQLNALTAEVEQRTTAEIAVVVVHTTAPMTPKQYVTALFNRWGVGKRGTDNGVMVLLAIDDRRVEIETGYGVEGILPDGKAGEIIRTAMLPSFKQDRWGDGLVAGTQRVAQVLLEHAPTLHPPAESRHPILAARDVVYWIGWGYFVVWLGFLLIYRVRHHILSYRVLTLITVPGIGFLVWAFVPFIVPFLIGLFLLAANVRARCPTCGSWLSRRKRTLRTPTRDKLRETAYDCLACGYHDVQLAIPGRRAYSGSSGWSGSSGADAGGWSAAAGGSGGGGLSGAGGSGGDGSSGGGSSGGGGAGGSF